VAGADLDYTALASLTGASIYAVTDNAGTASLDTLTSQDISAVTNVATLLTSLTYDKVTAVFIYPDNSNESSIQTLINTEYGL